MDEGDKLALDRCVGRVLDIGAGAGRHSLFLQTLGYEVHAIDICPELVLEVLPKRGVHSVEHADIFSYSSKNSFDTILLLGHGLGLAGSLTGLGVLLDRCATLLSPGGIIIADSIDVSKTDEQVHIDYQKSLVRTGQYRGEMRFHLEYGDLVGVEFGWLHIDIETLASVTGGWNTELIWEDEAGNYFTQMTKSEK
jgi:SAM-dependent methyltransferase